MMLSSHIPRSQPCQLEFSALDASLRGIRILNRVPISLHFISRLYLDGNHLLTLNGIEQFHNLEVLHFDYNLVSLPNQLKKIQNVFFLEELSFIANPIHRDLTLNLETFKEWGFNRLKILNPPHDPNHEQKSDKREEKALMVKIKNIQQTARRRGVYEGDIQTSRKKKVGKLYYNYKYTKYTQRLIEENKNSRQKQHQHKSGETRHSTTKPAFTDSPIDLNHQQNSQNSLAMETTRDVAVQPFESSPQTATFSHQSSQKNLSEQVLQEQKLRLATLYYERTLLDKSFLRLRQQASKATQFLSKHAGELLSNRVETLHFSFIKLRHQLKTSFH